jgi:Holliday junction resolvase-like predicted endonuclease
MHMDTRPAGHHARQHTRRLARRGLAAIVALVVVAVAVAAVDPSLNSIFLGEGIAIGGLVLLNRLMFPRIDRWSRGAAGEEHVGRLLEELESEGWVAIHDVDTGRGNIDTIVVGPGGVFTVEVKSHRGKFSADRVEPRMLKQAYAQKKWVESRVGHPVTPLLVFSSAYLIGRPVSRREGVTVLPARMLCGHLRRRAAKLSNDKVAALRARLAAA